MQPALRAVIFDLDGTLVDSYTPIADSLNTVRRSFGLTAVTLEQVRGDVGRGLESLLAEHVGEARVALGVERFRSRYAEIFLEQTRPLEGAVEAVRALHAAGLLIGVASNKPARFGAPIVEAIGLGDLVDSVFGPDRGVNPKPEPEMLLATCRELGSSPGDTIYIGDMPLDLESARRAGLELLLVSTGSVEAAELERIAPGRVAADLRGHLPRIMAAI